MDASASAERGRPLDLGISSGVRKLIAALFFGLFLALQLGAVAKAQAPTPITCVGGDIPLSLPPPAPQPDLIVKGTCTVQPNSTYFYRNVNIIQTDAGDQGQLIFAEQTGSRTDFWAASIIIENHGAMMAGDQVPFGTNGGTLTIHIYGQDQSSGDPVKNPGQGVLCRSAMPGTAPCGIPEEVWANNGVSAINGCGPSVSERQSRRRLPGAAQPCLPSLPTDASDYFYQYGPLYGDGKAAESGPDNGKVGYFGYKTLAVSFGGTLVLRGYKGASYDIPDTGTGRENSGVSWIRLLGDLAENATSLQLQTAPGDKWASGDEIVVTTTDYLPGHSEPLKINPTGGVDGTTINFTSLVPGHIGEGIQWPHNGTRYGGPQSPAPWQSRLPERIRTSIDPDLTSNGAETRAAVALLTRSIRIVSEGDVANETFTDRSGKTLCPDGTTLGCYYFGGHTVVRQGFEKFQVQGVEFAQLGQGGRLAHYPVHFHMARQTPPNTFVKDSSVNESMTRWYVIHSTQGVTLARNVGWKSIGHGYYLEDATETDNNFYSNIGIFARAAVDNDQNSRKVPGILDYNSPPPPAAGFAGFPYRSDGEYPAVFWITNGWNDFIGNMGAGAGTCGACYWFVPASNSDMPDVPPTGMSMAHMQWSGYAALQSTPAFQGTTPLKSFYKNYCTSAMHSFQTTGDAPACNGVLAADAPEPTPPAPTLREVSSIAPIPAGDVTQDSYYPHAVGGFRLATRCKPVTGGYDCSGVLKCANGDANSTPPYQDQQQCAVTILDHYTSAFNWANGNISAVWLRPQWYLVDNSVLSDVQNGALTFITGGDYTHSSIIEGYWGLIRNSVLVGTTQPDNPYATNAGPFNNIKLSCDNASTPPLFSYCINRSEGISMPLDSFFVNQRFFNIYDGPAYQDSNAYLDITKTICPTPTNSGRGDCMYGSGLALGVRRDPADGSCYLPNAAIAWKQPNGFLYPPAFHSTNLFFGGVDIRHYVIDPLFQAPSMLKPPLDFGQGGTYLTDVFAASDGPNAAYCANKGNTGFFDGFTDIDRQTELNDDDGSLTGLSNSLMNPPNPTLKQTISVNADTFFDAPVETAECESNLRINAANACSSTPPNPPPAPVTAKTSPYDYVLTVVAPGCSQNPPPIVPGGEAAPFGRCGDQASNPSGGQGGSHWSSDCTNQACYGVPLYRQLLAGDHNPTTDPNDPSKWTGEWQHWHNNGCDANGPTNPPPATPQCRWPFIRMAGANINQRNTLTINHGVYYLETTVPLDAQEPGGENFSDKNNDLGTRNVNVFEKPGTGSDGININGTYYVFFLYAKNSTTQTYQIYVGPEAQCNSVMSTLKAVRGNLDTGPIIFGAALSGPTWFTAHCNQDGKGILTVTIDFQLVDDLTPSPDHGSCKPQQFCCPVGKPGCQANPGKSCGCVLAEDDPLVQANSNAGQVINECKAVCGEWAVKDLDCPEAGCYGFAFTLPDSFVADGVQTHRPPPQVVEQISDPAHLPDWTTEFLRTTTAPDASTGSCFYPDPLPGNPGCPVHQ